MQKIFTGRPAPAGVLFDMDHTLINNDCDVSWKTFMVERGLAPQNALETADYFYQQYRLGKLDFDEFLAFQLAEFRDQTPETMATLAAEHFETYVKPTIYPEALKLVKEIVNQGTPIALLTATNQVIAQPVADYFGISEVLSFTPSLKDGHYTGGTDGVYSAGEGKVTYALNWAKKKNLDPATLAYFGDSTSDIPVMSALGYAAAVNPVPGLKEKAQSSDWPIVQFVNATV